MQHRIVGAELARRQPFQVEVGFDLGMELLMGAVITVGGDNGLRRIGKTRPPTKVDP
jgi:hypothetical protein